MSEIVIDRNPRALGASDIKVAPIAYGMWRFAGATGAQAEIDANAKVESALEAGITLFDTADVYGLDSDAPFGAAEELFGHVLKARPALRDQMVIASKGGIIPGTPYDSSAKYLREACEASLKRLQIETIDLYQVHRPDLLTHPAELADTIQTLRKEGKIREYGLSNVTAHQIAALQAHLDHPMATQQPELSALAIEPVTDGVLDLCMATNMTPLAWSPLAGGRLMLHASEAPTSQLSDVITTLDKLADKHAASRTAIALAFVLAHPSKPVAIIGSQTPARIADAMSALDVTLSREDWYSVYEAALGAPLP